MNLEARVALLEERALELNMSRFAPHLALEVLNLNRETDAVRAALLAETETNYELLMRTDVVRANIFGLGEKHEGAIAA